jgi:DNA polymerase-3 subunit alpha
MLLDFAKQKPYNKFIIKAHQKYGIPLEVSNDCHYCEEGDSKYQRLMLMIQTKNTIADLERKLQEVGEQDLFELQDQNLWMKSEEELNEKWEKNYSDILDYDLFVQAKLNTVKICEQAGNIKFDYSMKFPELPNANEVLKEEVVKGFKRRNLPFTKEYQCRLKEELELMAEKNFSSYFLILKKALDEGRRYARETLGCSSSVIGPGRGSAAGSFVCYCLGITGVNPIKHGLLFSRFLSKFRKDFPDVDVDFLPQVRDYLKNDWAPNYFGQDYVCNIGTYNTYGIKSALIDMVRIYGKDRNEVLQLTTKMGLKDDEGHVLTWDKALELYSDLRDYCDKNKEIAEAAKKLVGRNKSMGKHAGGIIISSKPINKFVPLVKGKEGEVVSAWAQGLHDQDLEPVGFIKQDWLVIKNLEQINYACKLIKERHKLSGIYALEGQDDFTDDKFIEDAGAITLANSADLKGIFQFDSDGIRNLVSKGGVTCFDDLVAYTAVWRPGPMDSNMHNEYVARKKGEQIYSIHSLLQPILGNTYGVIVYQEQVMKMFNVVGEISLQDCYTLVKAISKKNEEYFREYKIRFVENGIKNLGWTQEEIESLWKQIEAFAGYAFNLCIAGDMFVKDKVSKQFYKISDLENKVSNIKLDSYNGRELVEDELIEVFCTGEKEVFEIELNNGLIIKSTLCHKFYCSDGLPHTVKEILEKDLEILFENDI